nr:DUF4177 domain-containing protein [uncultured Ruegeria sp.]
MQRYEYKVVPAPQKGTKAKGVKTPEGRFANSVEQLLNQMGQDGWEYQRAELLPSEERSGLTGSTTHWRNVLVFRRAVEAEVAPVPVPSPTETPEGVPLAHPIPGPDTVKAPEPDAVLAPGPISAEVDEPPLTLQPGEKADEDSK